MQTHFPDEPTLGKLIHEGYLAFAQNVLNERKQHELPPYRYLTLFRAESLSKSLPLEFLGEIADKVPPHDSVNLLGPVPSPMEKRAGKHRAQLLVSSSNRHALQNTVKRCVEVADQSPTARKVRWSVDVDPVDLF